MAGKYVLVCVCMTLQNAARRPAAGRGSHAFIRLLAEQKGQKRAKQHDSYD